MPPSHSLKSAIWLILTLGVFASAEIQAANRYVSLKGVAGGAGTETAPWSPGYALSKAQPGDTVYFRGGVYANTSLTEFTVSGREGAPITFTSYPGETVVIDGTNAWRYLPDDGAMRGLVTCTNRSYLIFDNLEVRNLSTRNSADVAGILIRGASHHITVRRCNIHHIETSLSSPSGSQGTANGIAVLGQVAASPVNNILIDQCEVHHLKCGTGESVVFNGNVENFRITNCDIHDCNNIGIDCIGYERVLPGGGPNDRARNGLIQANVVSGIDGYPNPAYGGVRAADGIYVDGGLNIVIERNYVTNCNLGIELACEHRGGASEGCVVRNNFVWKNHVGGIFLGGSDARLNGGAVGNLIFNNTLYQNDVTPDRMAEIVIQNYAINNVIKQNIIHASSLNRFIGNWDFVGNKGNVIDWNVYYSPSGAQALAASQWMWQGNYRLGFGAWKALSGTDANSTFADPKFRSVSSTPPDLHLTESTAARDRFDPTFLLPDGLLNIDGHARALDGKPDAGADEFLKISP